MRKIQVSQERLESVIGKIISDATALPGIARRFQTRIPGIVRNHIEGNWGGRVSFGEETEIARAKRWGYYRKHKTSGVNPWGPPGKWTGRFENALNRFSSVTPSLATVNPMINYRSSDGARIPHLANWIISQGGTLWPMDRMSAALGASIDSHLAATIGRAR